ncbi:MAG: PSD1 and planctomycete cytochrome C domain-containing protein [Pirellulales bacterium]
MQGQGRCGRGRQRRACGFAALAIAVVVSAAVRGDDTAARLEFFERRVRPLLVDRCHGCHSAETKASAGLRVDDRHGLLEGGRRGPAVVPGNPEASLLIRAVRHLEAKASMPPDGKLTDEQIADLERWIADGSVWPEVQPSDEQGGWNADHDRLRREHWSFQPLDTPAAPPVDDEAWPRDAVDRFILVALEEHDLHPVADADRRTLAHRLFADLTGLPPTPEEVDAFAGDDSAEAAATLVDRLLGSAAYGERWGRHWLDVARYGESTGSARNLPYPHAWRYRDYVIDAFNADVPYDRFIREQIAGDLLPADTPADRDRQLIATGFLALGVKDVNQRFKVRFVMDNVDEQIDTVGKAVLALTVSCARCHDHKFDPIPTTDYYALAGIFQSTELCAGVRNKMGGGGLDYYDPQQLIVLGDPEARPEEADLEDRIAAARKEYEDAREAFEKIRGTPEGKAPAANGRPRQQGLRQAMNRKQQLVLALTDPAARGSVAHGVRDASAVGDTEIRVRGEAEKLGPVVTRGYLTAVAVPGAPPVDPAQSGRLQLAEWLTSPRNPLTARVAVNRIWQRLFGEGLVRTVDNFGVTGDEPSHPELLDHLAAEFIRDGWSTKRLVRRLVLTRTYGLSAVATTRHLAADPSNRLLWRHAPRRLDAEEIRDAMLAITGRLDRSGSGESPARSLQVIELRNNGPEAAKILSAAKSSTRRSVYLPLLRTLVPESLAVFDVAEQGMVTGRRELTTVSPQSLFMLNDPFVLRQSLAVAERLLGDTGLDDPGRVAAAYRAVLGRSAAAGEIDRALAFLAEHERIAASSPLQRTSQEASAPPTDALASDGAAADVRPDNPDDVDQTPVPVIDELPLPADANEAAWAAFVQVLFASAEFRYLR